MVAAVPASVAAQTGTASTVTYTYDSKGRLITAERVGGRNFEIVVSATFDNADNRTQLIITGKSKASVIVVPLNGYTVIPIP